MKAGEFSPVYPAYHPVFVMACANCANKTESPKLLTLESMPGKWYCTKCVFVYWRINSTPLFDALNARDSRELNEYGSLYGTDLD